MAGLPAADGRVFSDVDILVPEQAIPAVESALMLHGWSAGHHGAYYQRYYRQWMHEIPPMRHARRRTVIDVHHAILPKTARIEVDSDRMREAAIAVAGDDRLRVLAPVDMVLHSATHLFHEGELDNGLRDLFDLDSLLRHFGAEAGFWETLVPRAVEVGLTRPLYYALRYASQMLSTPIPADGRRVRVDGGAQCSGARPDGLRVSAGASAEPRDLRRSLDTVRPAVALRSIPLDPNAVAVAGLPPRAQGVLRGCGRDE